MINSSNIIFSLLNVKGIGTVQANRILLSNQDVYNQSNEAQFENGIANSLNEIQRGDFFTSLNSYFAIDCLNGFEIKYYNILDEHYPIALKNTLSKNTPTIISTIGNIDLVHGKKVGFCGSRMASEKGLDVAEDCVEQLVDNKVVIVSGYASGIDEQTHLTALKNGGSTIIVLPEGIKSFRIKKELKSVWDWNRVLVISEFMPNAIWSAGRAMQRNNSIIALSEIMILIESGETGGSMEAGKKALDLNKYLFAPVYQGMPKNAIGNQILLNKGAFPLKKNSVTLKANLSKILSLLGNNNNYGLL